MTAKKTKAPGRITTQAQLRAALKKNPNADLEIDAKLELTLELDSGSPTLRLFGATILRLVATGSSQPSVVARESSRPSVVAWGSSQPSVVAWGSSQPSVVARESSQPSVVARGSSRPSVEAWGSSRPSVEAWESSQPSVVAWGSSQPSVVAWGSSQPSVVAWGSSQPSVTASGYVQLSLSGLRVRATATAKVAVLLKRGATADGGQQTRLDIRTPADWCDYYGLAVTDGVVVLYKALNDDYRSPRGALYAPGANTEALDWDGGERECGGGLHFSPSPAMALEFHPEAKRFMACPVRLDVMAVHPEGEYPQKCKARSCGPNYEVDRRGRALGET